MDEELTNWVCSNLMVPTHDGEFHKQKQNWVTPNSFPSLHWNCNFLVRDELKIN